MSNNNTQNSRTGLTIVPFVEMERYIGKCAYRTSCGAIVAKDYPKKGGSPWQEKDGMNCPKCGRYGMRWSGVKGKLSNHKCDSRCTSAKGFNCECSCGGANHGEDYL